MEPISLLAALIAGLAASGHCFAMCGGIASALGMHAKSSLSAHREEATATVTSSSPPHSTGETSSEAKFPPPHRGTGLGSGAKFPPPHRGGGLGWGHTFTTATLYQLGRVTGYTIAGAIFGFIGSQASALFEFIRLGSVLRLASGVLIALLGARLLWRWNALQWIERLGAKVWIRLRPLVQLVGSRHGIANPLAMGLLWSLLPCGLIYSMLVFAAMSADAGRGASIMLAFGLGTLPSMLSASLLAARVQTYMSRPAARILSGTLMLGFGVWMIVVAIGMGGGAHAHH